ncbi:MAG: hypothetical protein ACYDFU_05620 [Nitrospirota bacterium]
MRKNYRLAFDLVYILLTIYFIISIKTLGGGIIFFLLAGIIFSMGNLFFKRVNIATILLSTFFIMLAAFNFFAQIELTKGFSNVSYVTSIIIISIVWLLLLALLLYPIKTDQNEKKIKILKRSILSKIGVMYMVPTAMIWITGYWFTSLDPVPLIISKKITGLSNFIPIYFIICEIYIYLALRKVPNKYFHFLLRKDIEGDLKYLFKNRKKIIIISFLIFFMGAGSELIRNNWVIYISSYFIFLTSMALLLYIWGKFANCDETCNEEIEPPLVTFKREGMITVLSQSALILGFFILLISFLIFTNHLLK